MARYQVMFWKHIPSQVKAWDETGEVKRMLPDRFMAAIDAYAMREGSTEMDAYLDGWRWSDVAERDGAAAVVVETLVAELDRDYPRSRLLEKP
jgi:cvfA/B/C family virulence factor